jgi:hypothetical protein
MPIRKIEDAVQKSVDFFGVCRFPFFPLRIFPLRSTPWQEYGENKTCRDKLLEHALLPRACVSLGLIRIAGGKCKGNCAPSYFKKS